MSVDRKQDIFVKVGLHDDKVIMQKIQDKVIMQMSDTSTIKLTEAN